MKKAILICKMLCKIRRNLLVAGRLFTKKGNHDEENATTNSCPKYRSLLLSNCPGISFTL